MSSYLEFMFIPGRLRATTLGDVLGTLHRAGVTGELELISRTAPFHGCRHEISVRDGMVTEVRTPVPVLRLGEVLLSRGALSADEHREFLFALHRRNGRMAGEVLVGRGLTTPQRVLAALEQQNRLRLEALFGLEDADVRFHPATRRSPTSRRMGPSEFLHGRPRARSRSASDASHDPYLTTAFETLGLAPTATREQVRRAFRRLASTLHPDLHPNVSEDHRHALEARFAALSRAYHTIITHSRERPRPA